MASKLPAVKGAAYTFRAVLFAQSGNQIKTSPSIAAGDFTTSKDGGAFGNLATIPAESPASSGQVLVTLSASEMDGDEITVRAIDASGDEWHSQAWTIMTAAQTFDALDGIVDTILLDTGELQGDWADGGRLDLILDAAGSAGDPWSTELPGAYGAGTAGEIIGGFSEDLASAIAALGKSTVTVINTVDGGDAAVYQYATWNATFTLSGSPALEDYENVIFCVKDNPNQADADALLYVDTATGLKYIGGQEASAAGKGVLTINSATAFNVYVDVAEVAEKLAGTYSGAAPWELKGIETGTTPDEAVPIATGTWRIVKANIRAIT
jgi:hypothetical protein